MLIFKTALPDEHKELTEMHNLYSNEMILDPRTKTLQQKQYKYDPEFYYINYKVNKNGDRDFYLFKKRFVKAYNLEYTLISFFIFIWALIILTFILILSYGYDYFKEFFTRRKTLWYYTGLCYSIITFYYSYGTFCVKNAYDDPRNGFSTDIDYNKCYN